MRILALDASGPTAAAALCEDERPVASGYADCGLKHSVTLLPMAEELLGRAGWRVSDLDLLAVTSGPGSFTGLRIASATAQGLALAAGTPCCGVSSLEAAAWGAACCGGLVLGLMDARRGEFYTALFESRDGRPERLTPDAALSGEAAALDAAKLGRPVVLVGDGAAAWFQAWGASLPCRPLLAPPHLRHPSAWGAAMAARRGTPVPARQLKLAYLRRPQAEREAEARQNGGTRPELARHAKQEEDSCGEPPRNGPGSPADSE